jgi:hypothetical protein
MKDGVSCYWKNTDKMSENRMLGKIFGPMRAEVGRRLEKSV